MEKNGFLSLGLNEKILKAIDAMGFEEPSKIQEEVIPYLLEGHDVIGQAQTGTGKTLAFGAPILNDFKRKNKAIHSIVLAPTRELAIQVNDEINRVAKFMKINILPVYGGSPIDRQMRALRSGVDIVVGTPGRVLDLMRRNYIDLSQVEFLVLDEADEMLNMGFIEDIEEIIKACNDDRRTLLFSATMPKQIKNLAKNYMRPDSKHIEIAKKTLTVSTVDQYYFEVKNKDRFETLCRVLDKEDPTTVMIFCKTKKGVDEVVEGMQARGYNVEGMHGDMNQRQRMNTLRKFKEKSLDYMVATDVAARGIDVDNVSHVINYDLPQDIESYVHRIGRTGRANKEGIAYTIVTPREYMMLKRIEKTTKCKIKRKDIPTVDDIIHTKFRNILDRVGKTLEEDEYKKFIPLASELDEDHGFVDVAAALMQMVYEKEVSFEYSQNTLAVKAETVRLFVTVGKMDNLKPAQIVRFLQNTAGVKKEEIGNIDVLNKFSFVDVNERVVDAITKKCKGQRLNGRKVKIEVANRK